MHFIIQKETEPDIDMLILKQILDQQGLVHSYTEVSLNGLGPLLEPTKNMPQKQLENAVPVGTLDFVGMYLKKIHGINCMYPIEIPECLRMPHILKREYSIIEKKDIPDKGYYFLKYVSRLKQFSYTGELSLLNTEESPLEDGLYQLSEAVDIISEFRVFVHRDGIINIVNYNGKPYAFPDKMQLLEMVMRYSLDPSRPASYTMDVAILKDNGTALIEIHPWVSVGLYGYMFGSELPYCYRDGIDYYITTNTPISEWHEKAAL